MMTDTQTQKQREKDIISRIVQGTLPTYDEAMDVLNYEKIEVGEQTGLQYTGGAAGIQMMMGVRMMLTEAVWYEEGGSGSLQHSGKVNMGKIATTYFNIASRERQKQGILVWGCGASLIHYCMEHGLVSDKAFAAEIEQFWVDYDEKMKTVAVGERFMFRPHPYYTPAVCTPIGFNCIKDFHIVNGKLQRRE
mgnify:CR=1 FL=1|tara:strand:- start:83 stop:658 length:576 start_codon:yes stop_codon:yes gene_type:complete